MPADLIYYTYLSEDGRPRVDPGPVLRHGSDLTVFFFNEINRARPQVHSLLLRLMAERSVTAFNREYDFPYLLVFADRNRIEREETFELPAAARDRFFMEIAIETPCRRAISAASLPSIRASTMPTPLVQVGAGGRHRLSRAGPRWRAPSKTRVKASAALERYTLDLWQAIRDPVSAGIEIEGVDMNRLVQGGASPRGMAFLVRAARVAAWLDGRNMVVPEDLRSVFAEVMAHRVFLDPIYELRRDALVQGLVRGGVRDRPGAVVMTSDRRDAAKAGRAAADLPYRLDWRAAGSPHRRSSRQG